MHKPTGAVALAAYWRPATWDETPEPPERDARRVYAGWRPGTHGERDPGFALQERDLDVLSRLWATGGLLSDHIQALYFPDLVGPSVVHRRLRRLYEVGLVRRYRPQLRKGMGSSCYLFTLTKLGYEVLRVAQPVWWTTRWPNAKWDRRQQEREPGLDLLMHSLVVAEIGTWAEARLGREWIHESEPASVISAGKVAVGNRTKEVTFRPDAILAAQDGGVDWYLELERSAYLPHWRQKAERWERWSRQYALGRAPAAIVVAGYLQDSPQRRERSVLPLLRTLPAELLKLVYVLDLAEWDPRLGEPQIVPGGELKGRSA